MNNEKEQQKKDLKVKTILTSELQMTNHYGVKIAKKKKTGIHKSEVGVLGASIEKIDVFAQSSNVWTHLIDLLAQ